MSVTPEFIRTITSASTSTSNGNVADEAAQGKFKLERLTIYCRLKTNIDAFFKENPIFYQFKPYSWHLHNTSTKLYKASFVSLKEYVGTSDKAGSINKVNLQDLNSQIKVLLASLNEIQIEMGSLGFKDTESLESRSEEIKSNASKYIRESKEVNGPMTRLFNSIQQGVSGAYGVFSEGKVFVTVVEQFTPGVSGLKKAGETIKEGNLEKFMKGLTKTKDALTSIPKALTEAVISIPKEARHWAGRDSHTPSITLIKELEALSGPEKPEAADHIKKLEYLQKRSILKENINVLFNSEEYKELIPKGPYPNEPINTGFSGVVPRSYFRTWHASLSQMARILKKTTECLDEIEDTEKFQALQKEITDFEKRLDERYKLKLGIKEKLAEANSSISDNVKRNKYFSDYISQLKTNIDEITIDIERNTNESNELFLTTLSGEEAESNRKRIDELHARIDIAEVSLSDMLSKFHYCATNLDEIEAHSRQINEGLKRYKEVDVLVNYLSLNDNITDKLKEDCNGQVKQDTLLSRLFIKFPLILNRGLIA